MAPTLHRRREVKNRRTNEHPKKTKATTCCFGPTPLWGLWSTEYPTTKAVTNTRWILCRHGARRESITAAAHSGNDTQTAIATTTTAAAAASTLTHYGRESTTATARSGKAIAATTTTAAAASTLTHYDEKVQQQQR